MLGLAAAALHTELLGKVGCVRLGSAATVCSAALLKALQDMARHPFDQAGLFKD